MKTGGGQLKFGYIVPLVEASVARLALQALLVVGACSSCAGRTTVHCRPKASVSGLAFFEGTVSGKRLLASVAELICIKGMGSDRPLNWKTPLWWIWICTEQWEAEGCMMHAQG